MSNNSRAIVLFIFMLAIGIATITADNNSDSFHRHPAQIKTGKNWIFKEMPNSLHRHTQKLRGPLEVQITLLGSKPEKPGDTFVLQGTISSDESLGNIDYKWGLPEGVEVVNGSVNGSLLSITGGQPVRLELTLKTLTGDNHRVHFVAGATQGQTRFADATQYNTLIQNLLDESKKELLKSTQEHYQEKTRFKVFH